MNWLNIGQLLNFLNDLFGALFDANGNSEILPGSAFHSVVAAFATQGYWVHADMLYMIGATKFQHFAILIYMFAVIGGICGMALGAPPKMYLWFIMGPGLFHFLLGTTQPVLGVAWKVAGVPQNQEEVWKLAEVGLGNSYITERLGITINAYSPPKGGMHGNGTVDVAYVFAQFDALVSDTVQSLIGWLGIYRLKGGSMGTNMSNRAAIPTNVREESKWYLLSNLKWGVLDTITSARFRTVELRDALNTFMASTCGDAFYDSIDSSRYAQAKQSSAGFVPPGVFKRSNTDTNGQQISYGTDPEKDYKILNETLVSRDTYMPRALTRLLTPDASNTIPQDSLDQYDDDGYEPQIGSFLAAFWVGGHYEFKDVTNMDGTPSDAPVRVKTLMQMGRINCKNYLDILVRGFRWEAGHIYAHLAGELPLGLTDPNVLNYAMLYGWHIKKLDNAGELWKNAFNEKGLSNPSNAPPGHLLDTKLDENGTSEQQQYIINLIFMNLVKNEMQLAYNKLDSKISIKTSTESASEAVEQYQRTVGSRNKFGEVYTWAMMMPYMQGTLLYLLAIGYPFACMFVLLPGWHKIIFTWASFWVWAKIWDVGFAIVAILERSIWSTLGNSSRASRLNPFIADMLNFGSTLVKRYPDNPIYDVWFVDSGKAKEQFISYQFLDRAISMIGSMDLDLQNSYYIYIMAALYFAVPAVTGQLVLGAKAGVAGLVTNAFTQMSQETGSKAGAAFTADLQKKVEAGAQAFDQANLAKQFAKNGLLARALDTQNAAQMNALHGQYLGQMNEGLGAQANMINATKDRRALDSDQFHSMARAMAMHPGKVMQMQAGLAAMEKYLGDPAGVVLGGSSTGDMRGSQQGGGLPAGGLPGGAQAAAGQGQKFGSVNANGQGQKYGNPTDPPQTVSDGAEKGIDLAYSPLVMGIEAFGKMQSYAISKPAMDQTAQLAAQRSGINVSGFETKSEGDRLQAEGQRMMAYAQGAAQENAFYDKAQYAMDLAPTLAAMGVQAPSIGPKPTDAMYLARDGMAGADAENSAGFFKEGGAFQTQAQTHTADLFNNFNQDKMEGIYTGGTTNPFTEGRESLHRASQVFTDAAAGSFDKVKDVMSDPSKSAVEKASALGASAMRFLVSNAEGNTTRYVTATEGPDKGKMVPAPNQPTSSSMTYPLSPGIGATPSFVPPTVAKQQAAAREKAKKP